MLFSKINQKHELSPCFFQKIDQTMNLVHAFSKKIMNYSPCFFQKLIKTMNYSPWLFSKIDQNHEL